MPQADPDTLCATGSLTPGVPPALLDGFPSARPALHPSRAGGNHGCWQPAASARRCPRTASPCFLSQALGELACSVEGCVGRRAIGGPRGGAALVFTEELPFPTSLAVGIRALSERSRVWKSISRRVGGKGLYNCLTAFRSELNVLIYEKETKLSKKWLSSIAQTAKSEISSQIQSCGFGLP